MPSLSLSSRKNKRLSPVLTIGISVSVVFVLGIGLRLWLQSHSASKTQAPVAVAQANDVPVPTASAATPETTTNAPDLKLIPPPPPTGRESLFNEAVQTHLQAVAEVQQVNGISMTISNFYLTGGHVFVSVCFNGLGTEGWQIGATTLTYRNGELSSFTGRTTLDQRGPSESEAGRHCDTLEVIDLPVDADLSQLSLSVQSVLLAAADEGYECEYNYARWAKSARMKQLGITATCELEPGWSSIKIVSKPAGMTEEEALNIVGQETSGMILGPWTFTSAVLVSDK